MYGIGLLKGLAVTMRNMVSPGRQFTLHQYPDRRVGLLGLAKQANTNLVSYVLSILFTTFVSGIHRCRYWFIINNSKFLSDIFNISRL